MTFDNILEQAIEMLRRRGRLTYRALKRQFDLDDEYLDVEIKLRRLLHGQIGWLCALENLVHVGSGASSQVIPVCPV